MRTAGEWRGGVRRWGPPEAMALGYGPRVLVLVLVLVPRLGVVAEGAVEGGGVGKCVVHGEYGCGVKVALVLKVGLDSERWV